MFDKKLLEQIGRALIKKEEAVAAAESVTGGLIQHALSTIIDASLFYEGGITVYSIGHKCRHLGVEPIHALKVNGVSEKVAAQMAQNVCKMFCSNWGIAITGYASGVPESDFKLFAYFAISYNENILQIKKISSAFTNSQQVQHDYVNQLLKEFKKFVIKK